MLETLQSDSSALAASSSRGGLRGMSSLLSQGQAQMPRAFDGGLENRLFYIFDEWAADQDMQYHEVFYHKVLPELKSQR